MRILLWHVHGSWTTVVRPGRARVPPARPAGPRTGRPRPGADLGLASVRRARSRRDDLRDSEIDLVVLQRPHELELVRRWTGRSPGRDLPAVYVEHNTPGGDVPFTRHPLADQDEIPVVHVTHFNRLFWDCGNAPDRRRRARHRRPGHRYTGDWARAAVVVNDPVRRGRAVGTDLLAELADALPVDVFGMGAPTWLRRTGRTAPTGSAPTRTCPRISSTPSWPGGASTCTPPGGRRSGSPSSRRCTWDAGRRPRGHRGGQRRAARCGRASPRVPRSCRPRRSTSSNTRRRPRRWGSGPVPRRSAGTAWPGSWPTGTWSSTPPSRRGADHRCAGDAPSGAGDDLGRTRAHTGSFAGYS